MVEYCTSAYQDEITRDKCQEIRFSLQSINAALSYLESHKAEYKRIVIEIPAAFDPNKFHITLEQLNDLGRENPEHIVYDISSFEMLKWFAHNHNPGVRYMYHYPISDYNILQLVLEYDVTDIYLAEPLAFDVEELAARFNFHDKILRVHPAQPFTTAAYQDLPGSHINHFWILPQHAHLYHSIDIFELTDDNIEREATLVNVYTRDQFYVGPLDALVKDINLDTHMTAGYVNEHWAKKRRDCHQRCLSDPDCCHYCMAEADTYYVLDKYNNKSKG